MFISLCTIHVIVVVVLYICIVITYDRTLTYCNAGPTLIYPSHENSSRHAHILRLFCSLASYILLCEKGIPLREEICRWWKFWRCKLFIIADDMLLDYFCIKQNLSANNEHFRYVKLNDYRQRAANTHSSDVYAYIC